MSIYKYITVKDLIAKDAVTNLYMEKMGFVHANNKSRIFKEIRDTNIDAYYFLLVQKGTASVEIDMRWMDMQEGEILLLTPFSIVNFRNIAESFSVLCLFIERSLFERIPNYNRFHALLTQTGISKIRLETRSFHPIENTFSVFATYISRKHTFHEGLTLVLSDFLLLQIIEELYSLKSDVPIHIRHKDELTQQFFNLLSIHYKEQHGIQFYANALCVSTTYLSRIIRETTQKTVYYYIAEKIFTSARHLLACTDDTIADIANKMNFSDQSAFGKFFKAKAGMSPAQYRKQLGNCVKGNPPKFLSCPVNKPNPHR